MERQCTAHRKTGDQCKRAAILGGTVCPMHGGSAPQVKRSAQQRLSDMVDPALTELNRLIESAESEAVKLAAVRDVLDRAMGKPQQHVDVTSQGETIKAYVGVEIDRV